MKQNRKSLLKTTIAMTCFLLAGCAGSSSTKCNYCSQYEDVIIVDEAAGDDFSYLNDTYEEETVLVNKKSTNLSSSYVEEPDYVPVKPKSSCKKRTCSKKTAQTEQSELTQEVEVRQKPVTPVVELPTAEPEIVLEETDVSYKQEEERIAAEKAEAERLRAEMESLRLEAERLRAEKEAMAQESYEREMAQNALKEEVIIAEALAEEKLQEEASEEAKDDSSKEEAAKDELLTEETVKETIIVQGGQQQVARDESCEEVKDWVAAEGSTLRTLLLEWGDKVGWRIVWNMDRDYTLEASAVFRGRFVDVAAALLRSFARATPAPKGVFYKGNKVLVVSTREDENAD